MSEMERVAEVAARIRGDRDFSRLREVEGNRNFENVRLISAQLAGLWPLVRSACSDQTVREMFDAQMEALADAVGWQP